MRKKNKKDIEKIENILRSVKPPELADKEIESYKEDFNRVLLEKFSDITLQRNRRRALKMKLAYGLAIFAFVLALFSFMYAKPYLIRAATARIINKQFRIIIAPKDVIVKNGVGIIIYNYQEIVVNVSSEKVKVFQPVEYEPSDKEREQAVEIVRDSKEAKHFVAKKTEAPQDISKNDVVSIKGLLFPNSGKKLVEVSLAYTAANHHPGSPLHQLRDLQSSLMTAKFIVDIEKGEIQP